ncbi:RNA polymerase, sigma 54 (sigma N) factor [Gammaproteobacteria bacterium]
MKPSLQLRIGQNLAMTPQMQQAIRLLQLSTLELQMEIRQALESNPMLEEEEDESSSESADGEESKQEESTDQENVPELDFRLENTDLSADNDWTESYDFSDEISKKDFREYEGTFIGKSLQDVLREQASLVRFSEVDAQIAEVLLDVIDGDGYLTDTLEGIQTTIVACFHQKVDIEEIEVVLRQIQNFEPSGVGARDLRECLLIQLRSFPESSVRADAELLVGEHLALLARCDMLLLGRRTGLEEKVLLQAIQLIRKLHSRPGSQITEVGTEYLIPDVIVSRPRNGARAWKVELNPETLPKLKINSFYTAFIRRGDMSVDNHYLRTQLQEARWLLKSLQGRHETLLKVATAIVERQSLFLEKGEEAMRPLVLHDIADTLGMHESTISRVTQQKYMYTPKGVFELKYFFSSHLNTSAGGECSSTATRAIIRRLVAKENPEKPLSDDRIATLLSNEGIRVARRTVAKYREAMAIPPSNARKRL